ncbi:MAG: phosphopentomutase [Candidatus Cloacimonetes bacterium]|nr:phosphopentomutase [Candidatus Cloacimonadota bacterium]
MSKRAIILVLDGVGVGALPDASNYGDIGSNTISNVARVVGGLKLPNLQKLGIGNIVKIQGVPENEENLAAFGKMAEIALDKDSSSGHWEIAGLEVKQKFPTYPNGFPCEILDRFIELTNVPGVLCNKPYSGTEAIKDFGEEHIKTRKPIVYTSADSEFQIAAHEDVYPIEKLYEICHITREQIFGGDPNIGRIIARPFLGNDKDDFYRTGNRKDYSVAPPRDTLLDIIKKSGLEVAGVGKIEDLFDFNGLTKSIHTKTNQEGIEQTIAYLQEIDSGLIFINLVDFDSKWGHRNDAEGFAKGLEYFDSSLPGILANLKDEDLLFITADHGCDPTMPGTDHTREYIPLLVYGKNILGTDLGIRSTFSDIAATISDFLKVEMPENGTSFLKDLQKKIEE